MKKDYQKVSLAVHKKLKGKIAICPKVKVNSKEDLSIFYTPGVGAVSLYLSKHKERVGDYTIKNNSVAIVSDGSAVLGLGNIGPEGAIPVMEGKALLFKELANLDAFPIVLSTQDTKEIIRTVEAISPVFGAINLEDISAPRCFEVEKELIRRLSIPVMHDDQHGTAIVVLAAIINSLSVVKKSFNKIRVVILGAGAAGSATSRLLFAYGIKNLIIVDSKGIISKKRKGLDKNKRNLLSISNKNNLSGDLSLAVRGADIIIGVSSGGKITSSMIQSMAEKPIVFAMANPNPEISPDEAKKAGAFIVASGRSDSVNQVNNILVTPAVFRGALDNKVSQISQEMKMNAAIALASVVKNPSTELILPPIFDPRVVERVSQAIK